MEAAKDAVDRYGVGPGAVRTIAGTMQLHVDLEEALGRTSRGSRPRSRSSRGSPPTSGTIPALVDEGDVIISDALNHASIVDGVRLARAGRSIYPHADVAALGDRLSEARSKGARRILVITDGVFSMDGDMAPLPGIVEAAEEYEAMVMVDDAHGEGVLGRGGRGIVDHFGLHGRVAVEVGTMSKAFGVMGGYVAGPADLVGLASTEGPSLPLLVGADPGGHGGMPGVGLDPRRVDRAGGEALGQCGALQGGDDVIGVRSRCQRDADHAGDAGRRQTRPDFSRRLFEEEGVFAQAIGYPTVAHGAARIRVMVSASHSDDDLDQGAEAFAQGGTGPWASSER